MGDQFDFAFSLSRGAPFGSFWSMLRIFLNQCNIIIGSDDISIMETNTEKRIGVVANIMREKLNYYNVPMFQGQVQEVEQQQCLIVGIDIPSISTATRKIPAGVGLAVFKRPNEMTVNINQLSANGNMEGATIYIPMRSVVPTAVHIKGYDKDPTVRVNASKFSGFFAAALTAKCTCVEITEEGQTLKLTSYKASHEKWNEESLNKTSFNPIAGFGGNFLSSLLSQAAIDYGSSSSTNMEVVSFSIDGEYRIRIAQELFKVINKLQSLSGKASLLEIYYKRGLPLRIVSPWADYGEVSFYIADNPSVR